MFGDYSVRGRRYWLTLAGLALVGILSIGIMLALR